MPYKNKLIAQKVSAKRCLLTIHQLSKLLYKMSTMVHRLSSKIGVNYFTSMCYFLMQWVQNNVLNNPNP